MELKLSPDGRLRLESWEDAKGGRSLISLGETFRNEPTEGLFRLAAEKVNVSGSVTLPYWQGLAERYLTSICHVPEGAAPFVVEPLPEADRASLVLTAPPMTGGEYLSPWVLESIWNALDDWTHEAVKIHPGGLSGFLHEWAPQWRQVGRVCFHLAENKNSSDRPFAFMATYTSGLATGGTVKHMPLRKALQQYAGARNKAALLNLLSPVQAAAESCEWVKELVESGRIYQPAAWTAEMAYQLLQSAPALEEAGLFMRLPNWWRKRPRPQVSVTIGNQVKSKLGKDALLDFNMELALGGVALSGDEIESLLKGPDGLVILKGQWVEVDRERLREALDHWKALEKKFKQGEVSYVEGMRMLAGASADLRQEEQTEEEQPWVHIDAGKGLREILERLRDPGRLAAVDAGEGLKATLRPYQREGLGWLQFLTELGLGACLADDMGLGKTIQVLALLLCLKKEGSKEDRRPSLLVAPASLLGNWKNEAARFTPSLNVVFLHTAENDPKTLRAIAKDPETRLRNVDLAVTTYSLASRQEWLMEYNWRLVILDEAQAIKNPGTRQTKAVKKLSAQARIVLTGTPVENRLGDLWSIFDFINPGLLGSASVFQAFTKGLAQRKENQYEPLRRLAGPYILRRLKTDRSIIADLPDKTETVRYCGLTKPQVDLYVKTVEAMAEALAISKDMARRGVVLQSLMRLKQICNHPSQMIGDGEYNPTHSGKFARLAEICEEIALRQEKALIFTQFREIIDPLFEHLTGIFGREGLVLHGGTTVKKRKGLVEAFQNEDGPPFFILSLKAGGTGLNLTAASHVIHFDRWWNPAVENQATDRAFRIGQRRNVLVHKFVTRGTIEEQIDQVIAEKREMAEAILGGSGEMNLTELSDDELINLVRLDVSRAIG